MPKIEMGKQYRTWDGREVRIYAVDGCERNPVHGAIRSDRSDWDLVQWNEDGSWLRGQRHPYDLVEVQPRIKRTVWLNVYDGAVEAHYSKDDARKYGGYNRLGTVSVDIDFEAGEGLE